MADQKTQGAAAPAAQGDTSIVAILSQGDKGKVTYNVNGQDVALSYGIVRQFLTRGNAKVSDAEVVQFISLCKFNQLNPFLGEAYLVKYSDRDPASMITSKEALMKRAEASDQYDGFQAGVIVMRNNEPVEIEGSFTLPTDTLMGGWCKVYRKDRKFPAVARVSFQEFNRGQSTWKGMPGTMIRKVAEAQAFREAFPISLGGMYTVDEQAEYQEQPGDDGGAAAAAVVETQMKDAGKQGGQPLTFAAPAAKEATAQPAAQPAAEAPAQDGGDHNPGF